MERSVNERVQLDSLRMCLVGGAGSGRTGSPVVWFASG
jgi:hypothetical protein